MKTTRKIKKLPRKLSSCLMLALEDLEKAEKSKKYTIDMGTWFSFRGPARNCVVCLAGSVMAQSLQATKGVKNSIADRSCGIHPSDYSQYNADRLYALDYLRSGAFHSALKSFARDDSHLAFRLSDLFTDIRLDHQSRNKRKRAKEWREYMIWIAGILEAEGL